MAILDQNILDRFDETAVLGIDSVAQRIGYNDIVGTFVQEKDGIPGANAFSIKPMVSAGRPEERETPFDEPASKRPRGIDPQVKAFKDVRGVMPLKAGEYEALVEYGNFDEVVEELADETLSEIMDDLASYLSGAHTLSVAPIPSLNPSASADEPLAYTHILGDGSSEYINWGALAMTQETVEALFALMRLEKNAHGDKTHTMPMYLVGEDEAAMHKITTSLYGSSAMQDNFNRRFSAVPVPGMGDTWGLFARPRRHNLTIAYEGARDASKNGRVFVGAPEWNAKTRVYEVPYGASYAIVAGGYGGCYLSNASWT